MAWWSPPTSCEKPSPPSGMHGLQKWGIQQWGPFLSERIVRGTTVRLLYKIKHMSTNFSVLYTARTSLWSILLCAIPILSDVQNRLKADIGVCLIVVQLTFVWLCAFFRSFLTPTLFVFTALTAVHRHALVPASRKTQSGRVFAKFYQATTFLILTLLPAAVCAESDNQQDMEPEDSEPARIAQQPHLLSPQRDPGGGSHLCQACGTPCCVSQARGWGMEFRAGPSLMRMGTSLP
ncbi:hypothetical protein B0H16DRAFT_1593694, partial [Mycena metata]